jgi:hypothetical protein
VTHEINKRIETASVGFWDFYNSRNTEEKKGLLFYLCVKTYQLIRDFHFRVTIPGYWAYHHHPDSYAYKMYLDELGSKYDEIHNWSESTRKKCVTVYMRMLKEAGFIINNRIQKPDFDDSFYSYFTTINERWALDIYLLNDQEKQTIITYYR